jgi:hypothetical protein
MAMNWKERVAPGVAIMRERARGISPAALDNIWIRSGELNGAADTIERMAEELDNARQTILAFSVFGIVLALSAFTYAWRVG